MPFDYPDYVRNRARAARWILDRTDRAMWWRWGVLTAHNPDPEALKLADTTAYNIFTHLTARKLLGPFIHDDRIEAYRVDLGQRVDWEAVAKPPGWFRRYVKPVLNWLFSDIWRALIWLIGAIITAFYRLPYMTEKRLAGDAATRWPLRDSRNRR